ncbi:LLM class flavin-dependent oxidoreductase [Dactylosporangium vinaceum]|uniref:LLM class flavin-dependent oxidoreductase n=1 Tax=Dactylosporangium vinaceum TaxID=53362 RepID=A0ABV5M313_9ACTN|nr:LLM class flavin-dependent oxidoreductase [Dactylosporangium vinaceum]UAB99814.1 LLM class flavin-dependent oxidoreductase [Dactylosporangium vinaceum]
MTTRQLHLNGFLKAAGEYHAGWRVPGNPPDAGVNFPFLAEQVRRLEAATFDSVFLPDLLGVPDDPPAVTERVAWSNDTLEPTTVLAALSTITSRIGLVATASTSYNQPYTVARVFASLDHLSKGRAGWNVVTSLNDAEARNFGLSAHLGHAERYRRAEEFFDVVAGLWDSFDDGAVRADRVAGRFFDPAGLHRLDHHGEFFDVAGPLNIRRPPQGRPVIAQAGSSGPGRTLAARIADVVFTRALPLADAQAYYASVKQQASAFGRAPLVLPELATVVAPTRAEAEDRFAAVRDLLDPRVALADVQYWAGVDLTGLPLSAPLPPLAEGNRSTGAQAEIYAQAARDNLTIGDLVQIVTDGDGAIIGTPADVADHIEEYFTQDAADGFNVSFPWQPATLVDFTELVVPELRRRGLFRTEYTGATLRDHLGLPRPPSRYAPD